MSPKRLDGDDKAALESLCLATLIGVHPAALMRSSKAEIFKNDPFPVAWTSPVSIATIHRFLACSGQAFVDMAAGAPGEESVIKRTNRPLAVCAEFMPQFNYERHRQRMATNLLMRTATTGLKSRLYPLPIIENMSMKKSSSLISDSTERSHVMALTPRTSLTPLSPITSQVMLDSNGSLLSQPSREDTMWVDGYLHRSGSAQKASQEQIGSSMILEYSSSSNTTDLESSIMPSSSKDDIKARLHCFEQCLALLKL